MELQDYLKTKQKLLEAQLKAINDLLQQFSPKRKTQIEMVFDILSDVDTALHIQDIISHLMNGIIM